MLDLLEARSNLAQDGSASGLRVVIAIVGEHRVRHVRLRDVLAIGEILVQVVGRGSLELLGTLTLRCEGNVGRGDSLCDGGHFGFFEFSLVFVFLGLMRGLMRGGDVSIG